METVQIVIDGKPVQLELSSGRTFDNSGNELRRLSVVEDNSVERLCSYATRYARSEVRRQAEFHLGTSERGVLMDLGPGDVHIDKADPKFNMGYNLAPGIADIVCPVVETDNKSNKYFVWDQLDAFQRISGGAAVAPNGAVQEISPRLSSTSYDTIARALQTFISMENVANQDVTLNVERAGIRRVIRALMLEREIRVAALLQTQANWNSAQVQTFTAATYWSTGASTDPVKNIHDAIEASLMDVTRLVMSELVAHAFVRNPAVQKYTTYKDSISPIALQQISQSLGLPPILVSRMKYLATGTANAATYVWGKDVVMVHEPPENPPTTQEEIATCYTMRWNKANQGPDGAMQGPFYVRKYFDERRGLRGGYVYVVGHQDGEIFTSKYVGGLLKGALP